MKPAAKGFLWGVVGAIVVLVLAAIAIPSLLAARGSARGVYHSSVSDRNAPPMSEDKAGGYMFNAEPGTVYAADRMIIRNADMELAVEDVADTSRRIAGLAQQYGGFVERSSLTGVESGSQSAEVVLRVPAAKLDQARDAVRKLAQHVDADSVEAKDVTREYVDLDARLRNAKASEEQYLAILKKATAVKDIVEVQDKLNDVRGDIERLQGELKLLSSQIEMSSLTVKLHPIAEAQVGGIYWHPWLNIKSAGRDLGQGLANFVDDVLYIVILLPLIVLWIALVLFVIWIVWRIGRTLWRRMRPPTGFTSPKA
jgi:uncharacterized protein DUF4349